MAGGRDLTSWLSGALRHLLVTSILRRLQECATSANRRRADRVRNLGPPVPHRS